MRQLLQRLDSGDTYLEDVPAPAPTRNSVVVEARSSVVSAGTEGMLVAFGRAGWIEKARQHPDRVRQVLQKMQTDGIGSTWEAVRSKLEEPTALGYCSAGVVREVGAGVEDFGPGDRVVTNGRHAEVVRAPHTLAARIPDQVGFEAAAFAPVGAIAIQGIRNAEPQIGETVVVYGLGLVGLLAVQLLRASGCRVVGVDLVDRRLELARNFGADAVKGGDPSVVSAVRERTGGAGADAVLLTLATQSSEPMKYAARMSRKKGRLVLVGVAGLDLDREDYYEKELSLTVSCSYGPGRYDPDYERKGRDYPLPYVRWTAQRNFLAFLDLVASGEVDPTAVVTHRFPFSESPEAYDLLRSDEPSLGIVFDYQPRTSEGAPAAPDGGVAGVSRRRTIELSEPATVAGRRCSVGVVGAGNFARRRILPALRDEGVRLRTIASSGGRSASTVGSSFGFEKATTDPQEIFDDRTIDTVFVLTPHDTHAEYAVRALRSGKHVFVEKPLALRHEELDEVEQAARSSDGLLTVGFNRRFAPHTRRLAEKLKGRGGPLVTVITVNAGRIDPDHWLHDPAVGGGRIVGEGCHFIDLARSLAGSPLEEIDASAARDRSGRRIEDVVHLTLSFEDGSTAALHYLANGAATFPKERIECFFDDKIIQIDNWRRVRSWGTSGSWRDWLPTGQDKGHEAEVRSWIEAVEETGVAPIPYEELFEVSAASIEAGRSARGR